MDTTRAQQKVLDDDLVAPANHLKIGKFNLRLSSNLSSKEPTLQVINGKIHMVNIDNFRDMLPIFPKLAGQIFKDPPSEEEILSFIRELGHTGEINFLSIVNVNRMHQPWRSIAAIINKCRSGKTTTLESLRLSRAQILLGMFHNKNVDYVYLLWEDLVFQVENKNSKKNNDMYCLQFTKVIVNYFMAKDKADARRDKMFWHFAKNKADPESSPKKKFTQAPKAKRLKTSAKVTKPAKKKQPAKASKEKSLHALSEVALSEAEQMKLATKRSKIQFHSSYASGSGADKGTCVMPRVPDVPTYDSEDEQISWKSSDKDDVDEVNISEDDDDQNNDNNDDEDDDNEQTESDIDVDDFVHLKLSTHDEEERHDNIETMEDIFNPRIQTHSHVVSTNDRDYNEVTQGFNDEEEVKTLEDDFLKFKQTNAFAKALSSIPNIVDTYLANKMNEAIKIAFVNEQLESEVLTHSSNEAKTSHAVAANLLKLELKKILIDKMEIILDTYKDIVTIERRHEDDDDDEEPFAGSNRGPREEELEKNLSLPISNLAQKDDSRDSFNELMDTPLDLSAFVVNQLKVDTLTLELLVDPTFKLMKGSCKSLVELEYFLEDVYKETTNQLDWNNPEGQQNPHDMCKPLPLIPNSQGRRVIHVDHFINNDLAYLRGGASCRTYTTLVTKTKVADYRHIKWIEDVVSNTTWSPLPVIYHKHAYESSHDVYSRHRIIVITKLQIIEWHNYKHLDWIIVRKLTNLTIKERLALNVSLRMFTRSIVIQRHVEDLQLGVKSYQKKLNLTSPDIHRSDLKRFPNYSSYPNPRGFIYQNKDKKNKLMRIDELHKFSNDTLNDVWTALDDKERAGAMIQAIDKQLKNIRIMRSLEKFVGGRLCEGDFWLLERTI
nr:hypothetical protein [Tanacetum cinerariifolium]